MNNVIVINCKDNQAETDILERGGYYGLTIEDSTTNVSIILSYEQVESLCDKARKEVGELTFSELDRNRIDNENRIEELEELLNIKQQRIDFLESR